MDDLINTESLIKIIYKAVDDYLNAKNSPTISMKEFCKYYCDGKAPEWVRTFIFDEFPETNFKNGGWVLNPRGGKKTIIWRKPAEKWLDKHFHEIDWNGRLPS